MSRGLRIGFGQLPTTLYASPGRYGILSAPSTTFQSSIPTGLAFPRIALVASGGDQSYGELLDNPGPTNTFPGYSSSGPGTHTYTAMQQLGAYDLIYGLSGNQENWPNIVGAGVRQKSDLVNAIKGLGSFPNVINTKRTPYVFLYAVIESSLVTGSGYQTWANLIQANNWWLYETSGGTGTKTPSAASGTGWFNVNYAYAWNTAAGGVSLDNSIAGNAYGTMSNGMGPATSGANYWVNSLITQNRTRDSRFASLLTANAAPNADGLMLDNCFMYPNAGGNLAGTTQSWDGIGNQPNNTAAAYPSGASSLLARGQFHFFSQYQSYLASSNPGSTYLNIGNFGSYANVTGFGNTHTLTANAMDGVLHGGLLEAVAGFNGPSWQSFQTAPEVLANYNFALGYCQSPGLVCIGTILPATDGSLTSSFTTGGTAVTVTAGTPLEYQMMRCMLCFTLMESGFFAPGTHGYNYNLSRWYDEFGDDSLAQVNVPRGYLGFPVNSSITFSNGVMGRQFNGGYVLWNPWGNGVQTITSSQISAVTGNTYSLMHGTQQASINTGAAFSTYTFADGDGLILITPVSTGLAITNVNPLVPNATVGSFYDKQMNASGGTAPYTWSLVSATPSFGGWLSVTSTGLMQGTCPSAADGQTITVVVQLNDSAGHSVQKSYSLIVNT